MCCAQLTPQPEFIHKFVRGASNQTLLLLHGIGGNERELIPLGERTGSFISAGLDRGSTCSSRLWFIPDPRLSGQRRHAHSSAYFILLVRAEAVSEWNPPTAARRKALGTRW